MEYKAVAHGKWEFLGLQAREAVGRLPSPAWANAGVANEDVDDEDAEDNEGDEGEWVTL